MSSPTPGLVSASATSQVTLCVTGSVAAYKAVLVVRLLQDAGYSVLPVLTRSARRFVGEETFNGLTGERPPDGLWQQPGEPHVALSARSRAVVVAPATADTLSRLAQGRADDLASATVLCARCPILIAPAMHPRMWEHPATASNVERLRGYGYRFVGPVCGRVASGEAGVGRMAEPPAIVDALDSLLAPASGRLEGQHVVVTAGPTLEDLDPVRALTNHSSGKMGYALATAARRLGARVTLVSGPVALQPPSGVELVRVRSALQLQAAVHQAVGSGDQLADALIMCAAVADYRPADVSSSKLKRTGEMSLRLLPNPDVVASVAAARSSERPFIVAFAAETLSGAELITAARAKLARKGVDAIVANDVADALGGERTHAHWVTASESADLGHDTKAAVARSIVERLRAALIA